MAARRHDGSSDRPDAGERDRFRHFLESVLDWAWETDAGGVYTYVSPQVRRILGYQREELIGKTPFDLMPAAEADRVRERFFQIVEAGEPFTGLRNVNLHKNGTEVVLETSGVPIRDGEGRLLGFRGIDRDVTGHVCTERALIESRNLLQLVIDNIPVRVFWKDLDSTYLGCNTPFSRDAGFRVPEELIGKNDFEMGWAEQADLYRRDDRRVMDSGEPKINYEEPQTSPDGARLWLRTSKIPLRNADGEIFGVLGCYEDITERKERELTLRRYERIVNSAADLMAFVDRDYVYLAVNRAYAAAFGRAPDEITTCTVEQILGRDRFETTAREELDACLAGAEVSYQGWMNLPALGECYLDVRYTPFRDPDGAITGVVVSLRDLTEGKRAEDERRRFEARMLHAQKLESLGVLAGGIAHDFNNLLTGILGNVGMATRQLPASAPARSHLEDVEKAARRAADLCHQMLAYSGKGRFLVQPLDLSLVVDEMTQLVQASIAKNAALDLRLDRSLPAVEADATQVRQVVMNLVTNASDAIGDVPGVITVTTGSRECDRAYMKAAYLHDELPEGRYVTLEVSDTGCGMDAETVRRIFDPFFTTKFTGRGLGMAAVLGILRGHRGAISVRSEPGEGTTVRVLFPASSRLAESIPPSRPVPDSWTGTGTVLVVDDEEAVRAVAADILASAGFSVILAADGREAVKIFEGRAEDILAVLLDLTMPVMGGEATLGELRRIRPDVAVVLSSGYDEQEVTNRFAGSGLAAFVQKPYRPDDLLEKLRGVLERQASRS